MRQSQQRSISTPIILGAISVPLSAVLLVTWILVLAKNLSEHPSTLSAWILGVGTLFLIVIMGVLLLLSYFLAREIIEVRKQNSFIDSVTHELKTPLASLKLCLQTLKREELSEEHHETLQSMMLDDVDRLSSFIDDVLQASRLSHETIGVAATEVDVHDVVSTCVERVLGQHHIDRQAIDVDVDTSLTIVTDPAALEIVVKNLLDNAIKYSGDSCQVRIEASARADGRAQIVVTDSGIGIDKKHLKRIFQRFYRVDDERVRTRHGTGLGLFVVSSLVKNLGGSIHAESQGIGTGTTMRVILPQIVPSQVAS